MQAVIGRSRGFILAVVTCLIVAACTSPAPTGTAGPGPARSDAQLTDAQLTAAMIENLNLWRESPWFAQLHLNGGQPDVAVRDGVLSVATDLAPGDIAAATDLCRTVAAITHDSTNSQPLGILGVVITGGGGTIVDCRPPDS